MNPAAILLGAVQVLYTGAESATTWLQGVDRAHDVAYVTHEAHAPGAFAIESIDLMTRYGRRTPGQDDATAPRTEFIEGRLTC